MNIINQLAGRKYRSALGHFEHWKPEIISGITRSRFNNVYQKIKDKKLRMLSREKQ